MMKLGFFVMPLREPRRLLSAAVMAACAQGALADHAGDWQCATIGVGAAPAITQAASDYLGRAGQLYPTQLLGVVSAGEHIYLLNARDGGWSEQVRLGLMELRLAEPDVTAKRRFFASVSGTATVDVPAGDYACLDRERAGRYGLALDARGRMFLAPGKSVHLVDPSEWSIVVEVKAVGAEPLDFREILALSGRSGIYAGLTSRHAPPAASGAVEGAGNVIQVAVGPTERPDGEVVITPRTSVDADRVEERMPVATTVAAETAPAPVVVASAASPVVTSEPAVIVVAEVAPAPSPPASPVLPVAPQAPVIAAMEPAPVIVATATSPVITIDPPAQTIAEVAPAPPPSIAPALPVAPPVPVIASMEPAPVIIASTASPTTVEVPQARISKEEIQASSPPVTPTVTATVAIEPTPVIRLAGASAAQAAGSASGQSYEDYARTMKTLLELRRSGGVRSVSEMTYVHPAIEIVKNMR